MKNIEEQGIGDAFYVSVRTEFCNCVSVEGGSSDEEVNAMVKLTTDERKQLISDWAWQTCRGLELHKD